MPQSPFAQSFFGGIVGGLCLPRAAMAVALVAVALVSALIAGKPAIEGYNDFSAMSAELKELAKSEICDVTSLAKSPGAREVWLLTIGRGEVDKKPAILVLGNVEAPHLVGSELAVRVARDLVKRGESDDKAARELFDRVTFYVIPRPNPDGSEAFFTEPRHERAGNARKTDDDRDHSTGEDPPDDLNGDGLITMMRVEDLAGKHRPHPDDPRVMIEAHAKKNERGEFTLYVEGRDDDRDESFNEDGAGGVSFNRNFTFKYPYFKTGAGPNQVSEPETRALAEFAYDHPNIAAVFCFTPEDNLMHPWKSGSDQGRIRTSIQSADADLMNFIAEKYREIHGGKDAPNSPSGQGSASEWAYYHFGRWSLAARGWWIPKVEAEKKSEDDKPADVPKSDATKEGEDSKAAEKKSDDKAKKSDEKAKKSDERSAELVNALRWFEREKIDGFVAWEGIEHPDFEGKKLEIGGFKPFVLLNPPAKELDSLAEKHSRFLVELAGRLPQLKITESKTESLGGGVYRITATVVNTGFLPTMSEMGRISGTPYPLQAELQLPDGVTFIQNTPRREISPLSGSGGKAELLWLVRAGDDKPVTGKIVVYAPAVGRAESAIELRSEKS
jgi:hypothetical protein